MDENRLEARVWAQWMLTLPDLLILDTETTGLGNAEIVEIAVIDREGGTQFNSLIKPYHAIPLDVMGIHGITNERVKDAPQLPDVWKVLCDLLRGRQIVIYNASFDLAIIDYSARCWNLTPVRLRADCAMEEFAAFYGDWSEYHGSYKWKKLVDAAYYFGVDVEGEHSAYGDAKMTLGVLKGMAGWR